MTIDYANGKSLTSFYYLKNIELKKKTREIERVEINYLTNIILLKKNPSKINVTGLTIPCHELKIEINNTLRNFYAKIVYTDNHIAFHKII